MRRVSKLLLQSCRPLCLAQEGLSFPLHATISVGLRQEAIHHGPGTDGTSTSCAIQGSCTLAFTAGPRSFCSASSTSLQSHTAVVSPTVSTASVDMGAESVVLEHGRMARLADGAIVGKYGDTHVLATAVLEAATEPGIECMLQVDYKENPYAFGHIPSTFNRRERGNTETEWLAARAIDRALRPLFPPGFNYTVQVVATVLSVSGPQDADILAINAASAALMCSDIPWAGPVGAVRIGCINGQLVVDPPAADMANSTMNLTYAGTRGKALMVEMIAEQVSEEQFAEALRLASDAIEPLLDAQLDLARRAGKAKRVMPLGGTAAELEENVRARASGELMRVFADTTLDKAGRARALEQVKAGVVAELNEQGLMADEENPLGITTTQLGTAFDNVLSTLMRETAIQQGTRVDGRTLHQLRPLHLELDLLRGAHGSAIFGRGDTQSLCAATVGIDDDMQQVVTPRGKVLKRMMLHYSFPPYSVNEVGKMGQPNRRSIGHGNLAERALVPVIPAQLDFPFALKVNADTMASNGSSSMAAVCGGCLALKSAGVPLKTLVAGISVGLLTRHFPAARGGTAGGEAPGQALEVLEEYGDYALITDIQGLEDHLGDMDYKVAGSRSGLTAIQLDVKLPGVSVDVLVEALGPARVAREKLLDAMEAAIEKAEAAKPDVQKPVFGSTSVNPDFLNLIVGDRGARLDTLQEATGARVMVKDDGSVDLYGPTKKQYDLAIEQLQDLEGSSLVEGQKLQVKVTSILDYGAFIELPNQTRHLLHISELTHRKIRDIRDAIREGEELEVQFLGRDLNGNLKFSRKALLPNPLDAVAPKVKEAEVNSKSSDGDVSASGTQDKEAVEAGLSAEGEKDKKEGASSVLVDAVL